MTDSSNFPTMPKGVKSPEKGNPKFLTRRIRTRKEDSAFVYAILESHEGIVSYSTLASQAGDAHRDLELYIPEDFLSEVEEVLKQLGDMIYGLDESK